jgi:hypothetical protein
MVGAPLGARGLFGDGVRVHGEAAEVALDLPETLLELEAVLPDLGQVVLEQIDPATPLVALLDAEKHGVDVHGRTA